MKKMSGFSLMEMMVSLLVVSIIAAAIAPMLNKKMLAEANDKSPWIRTNGANIAFNINNKDLSASIGTAKVPNDANGSRFHIATSGTAPNLTFSNGDIFKLRVGRGSLSINTANALPLEDSVAIGARTTAGQGSVAIGEGVSGGHSSVAIGDEATVNGQASVAIGSSATVRSSGSVAIGSGATPQGSNSIAIGRISNTSGANAISIGNSVQNTAEASVAIGDSVRATVNPTVAIGINSRATSAGSIAIGENARATGGSSIAIGSLGTIDGSTVFTTASNNGTIAIGDATRALGLQAIAIGSNAIASGSNSTAVGLNARALHANSTAIGAGAKTEAPNQIMLGDESTTVRVHGNLVVDHITLLRGNTYINLPEWDGGRFWHPHYISKGELAKRNDDVPWVKKVGGVNYGVTTSDRRLKNVGKAFVGGLEEIKKLEVFNYTFKDDKSKTPRVGVMAQDLQKIFPKAVMKGEDGFLRIRMEDMFYALVNAVKELANKIDSHDKKIAELEKENQQLKIQNKEFEKRLADLEKKLK